MTSEDGVKDTDESREELMMDESQQILPLEADSLHAVGLQLAEDNLWNVDVELQS